MSPIIDALENHPGFARVILTLKPFRKLDFSESNQDLLTRDLSETMVFSNYIFNELLSENCYVGIGGYSEKRVIYRARKHFEKQENNPRCIHLGTDIWTDEGEPVYAPLNGEVHSFAFNNHYGDYGPTIILQLKLETITFFTLYGHLSLSSLNGLYQGKEVKSGEKIGSIGNHPVNGDWPPHLHFQVIREIGKYNGDFPGVSSIQDQEHFLALCPDPNLILRISENKI